MFVLLLFRIQSVITNVIHFHFDYVFHQVISLTSQENGNV